MNLDRQTGPTDPWAPGVRATDVPAGKIETTDTPLYPNKADIERHLFMLFPPAFVHPYPHAWIEIAFCRPDESLNKARIFSAFDLQGAAKFAADMNARGFNVYVGAALRQGEKPQSGRANDAHFLVARYSWADYDNADDHERITAICKAEGLEPAFGVVTGTVPQQRCHLYFLNAEPITNVDAIQASNEALKELFSSGDVANPSRVMRLAGTVNYPKEDKRLKGYKTELTALHVAPNPRAYHVDTLINLAAAKPNPFLEYGKSVAKGGRSDHELRELLEASQIAGNWHNSMRAATASMVGRGWSDLQIRLACAPYCKDRADDPDLDDLIDGARKKWNKPDPEIGISIERREGDERSANEAPVA
jgi:hypothetical protein